MARGPTSASRSIAHAAGSVRLRARGKEVRARSSTSSSPLEAHPSVGIDLGGTKIRFAIVAPGGRVLKRHVHRTAVARGARQITRDIDACFRTCLGPGVREVRSIGIGVAGQVDRAGVVVSSPNLGWKNVPLRAHLERALRLPVTVTNDVRAATYGEWHYGAGRGKHDLVCVFVGTGVGGGIVAEGQLRYGASDTAGEVGHMTIVANGRKCHCRNLGCLEAYVGGWAIAERAREAVERDPSRGRKMLARAGRRELISAKTVEEAARAGDPLARSLLRETTEYLAAGLVSVVNGFNPQVLVLGGGVIEGTPWLLAPTAARIRARALGVAVRRLQVARARLGPDAGVLGAASMARRSVPGGR
jgi:glucokinase